MARVFLLFCLTFIASPGLASAEWHITPFGGVTMLGDTSILDFEQGTSRRHLHGGAAVSWLSRGLFGVEAIGTWTPSFFEGENSFGETTALEKSRSSRTLSLGVNLLVTLPQRWTEYGLRPFVSGGVGLMHAKNEEPVFPVDFNTTAFNIGGGAVGFLSQRTGVRFDVRYHSTLDHPDAPSIGPAHMRYLTASVGIVFRR